MGRTNVEPNGPLSLARSARRRVEQRDLTLEPLSSVIAALKGRTPMEDERHGDNDSLRIEYLLERVNDIETDLFSLQTRVDRLHEQTADMMRLLEQSIRVVEYLQTSRLQHPSGAVYGCEASTQG
jgi:hypothetical protein